MITVKPLGGTKKSLSTDKLELDKDGLTVAELINYLQKSIPKNMPQLDVKNILVAINGIDSSTLQGFATRLQNGDVVSIIPVIHGGSTRRTRFQILKRCVELMVVKNTVDDPIGLLDDLRQKYPDLAIQAIKSRYILNTEHAKKIITISLAAQKDGIILSNKLEIDILMRFACTTQISEAIQKVGLQQKQDFVLIVIGKKNSINKLFAELRAILKPNQLSGKNFGFLQKEFAISKKQLQAVMSKTPLEDLLAEKAAVLFR